ncbi:pili/flagellar assembly PapD-like chaperone [Roseinatronobacter monicus]|uniref:Pili/flagellar assembly PapD-like chaperone n=2 Tax=Roseinatronobacter monicus TaxID=393481 RepID=A0A543K5U3_9RHOB|nr:pili/flagellar assembly PapD-like chaperone [Roseinatronobacter monicus]
MMKRTSYSVLHFLIAMLLINWLPNQALAALLVHPTRLSLDAESRTAVLKFDNTGIRRELAQVRVFRQIGDDPNRLERTSGFIISTTSLDVGPRARQEISIIASPSVKPGCYRVLVDVAPTPPGPSSESAVTTGALISVRHSIPLCF